MATSGTTWKLADHPKLPKGKIIAVVVLDGWGEASPDKYNCIHVAETPMMDSLKNSAPDRWRLVKAHGKAVGLPTDDDMGNSEVGHNALGAGRIFAQGAKLVDNALATGKIYEDEGFNYIKESFANNTLHLIGLMSDGGVHSRLDQLQLLLKGASDRGAKRIRVHVLTDGRDVVDGSSVGFAETLEKDLAELRGKGIDAQVASGGGRMYVTMDRYENDWEVVKRGWDAQVLGEAPHKFTSVVEAIQKLREAPNTNDQYLPPFVIVDESGKPVGPINDGDAVVTVNFRADRMTMLAQALEYEKFDKFDRVRFPKIRYAGMLQYDGELKLPNHYLVSPPLIERTSGEYLVNNGIRTFACSETVKFGHVTFFWNGNRSGYFNSELEKYVEIPSDSGITFNVQPKMKALEIGEKARDAILSRNYDQVRVNIPNGDMVGHTGDIEATVVACKAADQAVKMILDAIAEVGGIYMVTADHGNAEDMVKRDKKGEPLVGKDGKVQIQTSHTLQPVPVAIGGPGLAGGVKYRKDVPNGGLANVAATVINLHGFVAPDDYETTLIEVVD
ncbi:putative phosphotransferase (phosphomutase) [Helianthus annuus]|uniref:phosphoglycerate mutase (2,3-diphosphoglycerate-independent) n=1 Tax=Helianthus annuus TaxID=4232 RepID=A0A251T8V9_HELAN|nr:2,3-bisphosphoglycerate-independent phosphoglycerate mutase [Helianthus annuus]KAF5782506.1 putative phosphotransferase (phosphomutase) [Helianthus annuus]KAJ0501983.1 putative phosphotransferase (phosphomutase) [Helianthus annuus]KAJ0509928.1 putative phosphotransferase (phosphomutase) [Helianthus annuus]KAJ0517910.1 putative phosphotransferase (phosphomutase) [Helianthus annuus]KAJ0685928.1 putative phosphotransferase (phosphomutase) [Helianthus annuus]